MLQCILLDYLKGIPSSCTSYVRVIRIKIIERNQAKQCIPLQNYRRRARVRPAPEIPDLYHIQLVISTRHSCTSRILDETFKLDFAEELKKIKDGRESRYGPGTKQTGASFSTGI
jgi:hypothetical protein